jgi:butyryl-CoA dehydrogenase
MAHSPRETQKRIEECAVECSILKVYGSEMLTLVDDELIATMGGYGYVEEYPAERYYRDARINRIFEGTNEINRLIITGWLMKRAMSGQLPLLSAIKKLMDEVTQPSSLDGRGETGEVLAREAEALASTKKVALFAAGVASQRFMTALQDQQEVMADLADIIMQVYALESSLLRAKKLAGAGHGSAEAAAAMTGLLADETIALAEQASRRVWLLAGKATCYGHNWRYCGGWHGLRLPMRWGRAGVWRCIAFNWSGTRSKAGDRAERIHHPDGGESCQNGGRGLHR